MDYPIVPQRSGRNALRDGGPQPSCCHRHDTVALLCRTAMAIVEMNPTTLSPRGYPAAWDAFAGDDAGGLGDESISRSLEAARGYTRRGWRVIPIPLGTKAPILKGWQELRLAED